VQGVRENKKREALPRDKTLWIASHRDSLTSIVNRTTLSRVGRQKNVGAQNIEAIRTKKWLDKGGQKMLRRKRKIVCLIGALIFLLFVC